MGVSNITTVNDLFAVLDAIYAKTTYDTYSSLRLYYNQIQKTSVIYSTEEDGTENVIAVLSLESITEQSKVFVTRLLKSSTIKDSNAHVFDVALGGFIGVDLLIKNISRSLGVIIEDNFKDENKVLYDELVAIVANYYGDDVYKYPYIMRKNAEDSYLSYVPVNLIIEFAIYFNKLRLFTKLEKVNVYQPFIKFGIPVNQFATFMEFDEFKEFLTDFMVAASNSNNNQTELDNRRIEYYPNLSGRFESLYNKVDSNNLLVSIIDAGYLRNVLELPNDIILINEDYTLDIWSNSKFADYVRLSRWKFKITKESVITLHNLTLSSDGEILVSKKVFELTDLDAVYRVIDFGLSVGTGNDYRIPIINIKPIKYFRGYINYYITNDSERVYFKYLGKLSGRTNYKFSDLSKLSMDDLYYLIPYNNLENIIRSLLSNYSVEVTDKDFIQIAAAQNPSGIDIYKVKILVIKNLENFRYASVSDANKNSSLAVQSWAFPTNRVERYRTIPYGFTTPTNRYGLSDSVSSNNGLNYGSSKLLLENPVDYTIYTIDLTTNEMSKEELNGNDILLYNSDIDGLYGNSYLIIYNIMNLGMLVDNVDYKDESLIGISLEENAIYPENVIDESSFNSTYTNWNGYISVAPQIIDGVVDSTVSTRWKPLSMNPVGLVQETAQAGVIDESNITNILDSIDAAVEDNTDEPDDVVNPEIDPTVDPDVEPNDDKTSTNIGDTPDVQLESNLPALISSGVVNQYKMSLEQLKNFSDKCLSADVLSSLAKLFVNPVDAVISLQAAYMYNAVGSVGENIKFNGRTWEDVTGLRLVNQYVSESVGTITLEPYFNNYTDYTDTEIDLYLPFAGMVQLNVSDFINGDIKIDYRIDTLTGVIVYYVYSVKNGHNQLINLFDGNCQQVIPLSSSDFSRLYGSIFGVATAGVAAATGVSPLSMVRELVDKKDEMNDWNEYFKHRYGE